MMTRGSVLRWIIWPARALLLLLAMAASQLTAQEPAPPDARDTLLFLKSLLVESRVGMEHVDGVAAPRLFTDRLPDGRTWMDFIADTLCEAAGADPEAVDPANDYAILDEAVMLLLAEAQRMAELGAAAPPGDQAVFCSARRAYLAAAARLLKAYAVVSGGLFDGIAGGLVAIADELPDWMLPGEIQLREISGAGRINTVTLEFNGRLSGKLVLPKFDAQLTLASASFDSRGNLDLAAYGSAAFPPEADAGERVRLAVPPRRPLFLHIADDGDFRVAGAGILDLPGGTRLEAWLDVDDPSYEFGLAFTGGLTLELAKEVTLIRPVVTFDPANPPALAALDGFATFFGSLGKGLECFLQEAPDELPSPFDGNIGVAPDFTAPETVVPLDVFDAWITGIGNEFVRPAINGGFSGTLGPIRTAISNLKDDLAGLRGATSLNLAQTHRLDRIVELNKRMRQLLQDEQARQAAGEDGPNLLLDVEAAADEALRVAAEYLAAVPTDADFKTGMAAVRLFLKADANAQLAGSSLPGGDPGLIATKIGQWEASALANHGFGPDGTVVDADKVAALSPTDVRMLARMNLENDANRDQIGAPRTRVFEALLRVELDKVKAAYADAAGRGDNQARSIAAARLLDLAALGQQVDLPVSDAERAEMPLAFIDTIDAISVQDGGGASQLTKAMKLAKAAREQVDKDNAEVRRRTAEMFGEADSGRDPGRDFAARAGSFWEKLSACIQDLVSRGLFDPAAQARLEAAVRAIAEYTIESMASEFADAVMVGRNLEAAHQALTAAVDFLAYIEEQLPADPVLVGEFRQSWQALHVQWTAVAGARKAHWYLSAYVRELNAAASRYGDGVSAALEQAFAAAGAEAAEGLRQVVDALAAAVNSIGFEDFRMRLPGNLQIQRLSGQLAFNRISGAWQLGFGGRAVFPDINTSFEVAAATLASDGAFNLSLLTRGPLPFGVADDFTLDVATAFSVTGNLLAQRIDTFATTAHLVQQTAEGPPNVFDASLAYTFLDPGHRFDVQASFQDQQPLFTREIVLFAGGFGFSLQTDGAGVVSQAGLDASLTAGLLLRPEAAGKATEALTPLDFQLQFAGTAAIGYSSDGQTASLSLKSGLLTLPPDIFSDNTNPLEPRSPNIALLPPGVCVEYSFLNDTLAFCGTQPFRLSFTDFIAVIPGLEGAFLEIDSATLRLSGSDLPVIEGLDATLGLPLPGLNAADPMGNRTGLVRLQGTEWKLDGLPREASIALATSLRLVDFSGFTLDVLGGAGQPPQCVTALSFTSERVDNQIHTRFALQGGLRGTFDGQLLTDQATGAGFAFTACGGFAWDLDTMPQFSLDVVEFAGRFRIGGAEGLGVEGIEPGTMASIRFEGIDNLFAQTPATPFRIRLDGALDIADFVRFGLVDTAFAWNGSSPVPGFEPGGFQADLGGQSVEMAHDFLPVMVTSAGMRFKNNALALLPQAGQTGLLDPTNIVVMLSGKACLPDPQTVAGGAPGISGEVRDLQVSLRKEIVGGMPVFYPEITVDGLGLELSNLDIPPLGGITGRIFVGNLQALSLEPPQPLDVFFAGQVGAKVNDVGATLLLAAKPLEFIGACFELNLGPAGIPIDGGTLGGILLTGAKGGINFKNQFSDPCDFRSYIELDEPVPAPGDRGTSPPDLGEIEYPAVPQPWDSFNCVQGPFPPPSVNPLAERHPLDPSRIVYKGTIMSEAQLNSIGITRALVPGNTADAIDWAVSLLVQPVAQLKDNLIASLPPGIAPEARNHFNALLQRIVDAFDDSARSTLRALWQEASGSNPDTDFYDLIVQAAADGIPCLDLTLLVEGTLSHAAVSTVLNGSGAITLSSTGTAVLDGKINLVGIPVATGKLAFSLTDSDGNINPAFGGVAKVALGPLEFGDMSMAFGCDGCFTAVLQALEDWLVANINVFGADVTEVLFQLMDLSVPRRDPAGHLVPRDRGDDLLALFNELSETEKLAYLTSFLNLFQTIVNLEPLPVTATPQTIDALLGSIEPLLADILGAVNPTICFSGHLAPSLFGFPLSGGAQNLVGGGLRYGKVIDPVTGEPYQELVASVTFSPTWLLVFTSTYGYISTMPAIDEASMGYSMRVPAFTPESVGLMLTDPAAFIEQQVATLIEDAVLTFSYEIAPLGLTLGNGQGRMIMPRIATHPENPDREGGAWNLPAGDAVATRMEVVLAALSKGRIKDPTWRGGQGELPLLFDNAVPPNTDPETGWTPEPGNDCDALSSEVAARLMNADGLAAMSLLDFPRDYFPHGGLIFGAELSFPNVIAQAPPAELAQLFSIPGNLTAAGDWLNNATWVFENYLAATTCVGQMAGYLPAPNPVFPPEIDWTNAKPSDLIAALRKLDVPGMIARTLPSEVYPDDQVMLSGWLDAPLLGMPVMRGYMNYDANEKLFVLSAGVPSGTWLANFVSGGIEFRIRGPRYTAGITGPEGITTESLQDRLQAHLAILDTLTPEQVLAAADQTIRDAMDVIASSLPTASMEADAALTLPAGSNLGRYLNLSASSGLRLFAFSPAFEPGYAPADFSPYAVARRRGGIGLRGYLQVGYFPDSGDPIAINIPEASLSITPAAEPSVFPSLNGTLLVGEVALPGLPSFTNGELTFSNSPDNLAPYVKVAGTLEPFAFGPPAPGGGLYEVLRVESLTPGGALGGELAIIRDDAVPVTATSVALAIEPARLVMPFLGPDAEAVIYGTETAPGVYTPFSFATTAGQTWSATVRISRPGAPALPPVFRIGDPLQPAGSACSAEFTPAGPVYGTISGVGMESFSLEIILPLGFDATFFPDQQTRTTVHIGGAGSAVLYLDNRGRFYADLGQQDNIGLPGVLSAGGRLEFGYNPGGDGPNAMVSPASLAFADTDLGDTSVLFATVQNTGNATSHLVARAAPASAYTAGVAGVTLAPGASTTISVTFHPPATGAHPGMLTLTTNEEDRPTLNVTLSGNGISQPRYHQSRDSIGFGATVVGGVSRGSLTIGNGGSAPLTITSVALTDSTAFHFSPEGGFTLQPGESRLLVVEFCPLAMVTYTASLQLTGPDPVGTRTVNLTGSGTASRWITLLDSATAGSAAGLRDIKILENGAGWAVGDNGAFLETRNFGNSWTPRRFTAQNLRDIHVQNEVTADLVADYHFEDPSGTDMWRDDGQGGYHATARTSGNRPAADYAYGAIGSGLHFNNPAGQTNATADYLETGDFELPSSFAISLWVNPLAVTDGQCFVGKHDDPATTNKFLFGFYNGGYHVRIYSQTYQAGVKATGMQHLAVTCAYDSGANTSTVKVYRNGGLLWSTSFAGAHAAFGGGRKWVLGQDWDADAVTDPFNGYMDEVAFYGRALSDAEVQALAGGGRRIVIAGDNGTVLESQTRGRVWHQAFDQTLNGWLSGSAQFRNYSWNAATATEDGRTILAGQRPQASVRVPCVMVEESTQYTEAGVNSPASDDYLNGVAVVLSDPGLGGYAGGTFAASGQGMLFTASGGLTSTWQRHGTLDLAGSLNDMTGFINQVLPGQYSNGYIAVGDGGSIVRSLKGADPALISHGLTTGRLNAVCWRGINDAIILPYLDPPHLYVVGDNGLYLTSSNNGTNWNLNANGLLGSNYGVSVYARNGSNYYSVFTAGEQHRIQRLTEAANSVYPPSPVLTLYPGELDFGMLTLGRSKTLPLKLRNAGRTGAAIGTLRINGSSAFSIVQAAVTRIAPGDSANLQIRYRPTESSDHDFAELVIWTFAGTYRVPLVGRCFGAEWQPVMLGSGGVAVQGEVVDLAYTPGLFDQYNVYALVKGASQERLYRSTNSGVTWTQIPFPYPGKGSVYRFNDLSVARNSVSGQDVVALAGSVYTSGALADGRILRSEDGGAAWTVRTPNDGVVLEFGDVEIFPDGTRTDVMVACSKDSAGGADVWQTIDSGVTWTRKSQPPCAGFKGGTLQFVQLTQPSPLENGAMVAVSNGSLLYARDFTGEWPYQTVDTVTDGKPVLGFPSAQTIRSLRFAAATSPSYQLQRGWVVGDQGLFWRWERTAGVTSPFQAGAEWYPASNQEIFGLDDLAGVAFGGTYAPGYAVGGSRIHWSGDYGRSWIADFDAGEGARVLAVTARTGGLRGQSAWAGGSVQDYAVVWRNRAATFADSGILLVNDIEFFNPVKIGGSTSIPVELQNVGSGTLQLHAVRIENEDPLQRFSLVGTPPDSLAPGAGATITVAFDGLPDSLDLAALDPQVFLRFEDGWDATVFRDHSRFRRNGSAPSTVSFRPRIQQDEDAGRRDRCLQFDGGDYASVALSTGFYGDFSAAMWINPGSPASDQHLVGKHTSTGGDILQVMLYSNSYYVKIRSASYGAGTPQSGWQHIAVTGKVNGSETLVTMWKDGEILWSQTFASTLGNIAGLPMILGADYDNLMGNLLLRPSYSGDLDDFAFFNRVLSPDEIRQLAATSPACGEHRARLVIRTGAESGERLVELRCAVEETSELVVIDTVPSGQTVQVDSSSYTTPVAFSVKTTATSGNEWAVGSLHTLVAPVSLTLTDDMGNTLDYAFNGWSVGSGQPLVVSAASGLGTVQANYLVSAITAPGAMALASAMGEPMPAEFDIATALAGTPGGPFIRITNGTLTVAGLADGGFTLTGALLASLSRIQASLETPQLLVPEASAANMRFFELGPSEWLLDMLAGSHCRLKASPPSLKVLGYDVAPETDFLIELDDAGFAAAVTLMQDFKPLPDFLEFKKGGVSATATLIAGTPAYVFSFSGGLRLLRLPAEFADPDGWAVNTTSAVTFDTANFDISLTGPAAVTLVDAPPFLLSGSLRMRRDSNGPVILEADIPTFHFNGTPVAMLSGSISTGTELLLEGSLANTGSLPLISGSRFSLQNTSGGAASFKLRARALPQPLFQLEVPALTLKSTAPGFPDGGLSLPGITFDSTGAFDTGRLALPTWTFDGISITKPAGGALADNYIRLQRGRAGHIAFDCKAQLPFLWCALHDFALGIDASGVYGSFRGNFCVLPEPVSLSYNSGSDCQFQGSAFGFTVYFGSGCAGFRNDASGICAGTCP